MARNLKVAFLLAVAAGMPLVIGGCNRGGPEPSQNSQQSQMTPETSSPIASGASASLSEGDRHDAATPNKVVDSDEQKLYLTPGGLYTEADIKANGNLTASQKFKGFRASHDLKPKPGDKICPVTLTKSNPECTWIVGGKKYEFCCPPCVDEFLTQAKSNPELVKKPEDFIKR